MPGEIDTPLPQPVHDPLDPETLKRIDDLVAGVLPPGDLAENRDLAREMIVTSLKSVRSHLDRGDMKLLNRSMRELRYAFKIFKDYRDRRKVTLFGSARTPPSDPVYRQALSFARKIRENGFMVITGAGPGVMQAGNEGAGELYSFGINIRLPFEQEPNRFVKGSPRHLECQYFFTRKLLLAKEADAGVFFPGGFGTHDEAAELMTLIQTGKAEMIPIVMVDVPGGRYWKDWAAYIRKHMLRAKRISPEDLKLFHVTDSAKEACDIVLGFYKNYHSMRYVGKKLVLRVQRAPEPPALKLLSKDFKDILVQGPIAVSGALPEEKSETSIASLPRVVLEFNRTHAGRLRELIDRLNEY